MTRRKVKKYKRSNVVLKIRTRKVTKRNPKDRYMYTNIKSWILSDPSYIAYYEI